MSVKFSYDFYAQFASVLQYSKLIDGCWKDWNFLKIPSGIELTVLNWWYDSNFASNSASDWHSDFPLQILTEADVTTTQDEWLTSYKPPKHQIDLKGERKLQKQFTKHTFRQMLKFISLASGPCQPMIIKSI
jgi:hypothetical protein